MAQVFFALTLLAASAGLPLHAQTAVAGAPAINTDDPGNAKALAPPLVYRSPFSTYRAQGDAALLPWREANDRVRAIGGWRVYAREAQQPNGRLAPSDPAPPQPPASDQSPHKQ